VIGAGQVSAPGAWGEQVSSWGKQVAGAASQEEGLVAEGQGPRESVALHHPSLTSMVVRWRGPWVRLPVCVLWARYGEQQLTRWCGWYVPHELHRLLGRDGQTLGSKWPQCPVGCRLHSEGTKESWRSYLRPQETTLLCPPAQLSLQNCLVSKKKIRRIYHDFIFSRTGTNLPFGIQFFQIIEL
jgi:hypothetical protein